MRRFLDSFLWIAIIILFIPSYMIIASWNSLPGQGLYGTKLVLEHLALAITSPSYAAQSSLQLAYTEKRFAEAKTLLNDKHSIQGLSYLSDQVKATRDTINKAPNTKTKAELAQLYVQKLTEVSAELETQKTALTSPPASKTIAAVPPKARSQPLQNTQGQLITPVPHSQQTISEQPAVQQSLQQSTTTKTNTTTSVKTTTTTVFKQSSSSVNLPTPTQTVIAHVNTTSTDIQPENMMAALQISQTQETIQQTINELETVTQETTTTTTRSDDNSRDDSGKTIEGDDRKDFRGDNGDRYSGNNNGEWNKDKRERSTQGDH